MSAENQQNTGEQTGSASGARQYLLDNDIPPQLAGAAEQIFRSGLSTPLSSMTLIEQVAVLKGIEKTIQDAIEKGTNETTATYDATTDTFGADIALLTAAKVSAANEGGPDAILFAQLSPAETALYGLYQEQETIQNAVAANIANELGVKTLTESQSTAASEIFAQSSEAQACLINYEGMPEGVENIDEIRTLAETQAASENGQNFRENISKIATAREAVTAEATVENTESLTLDAPHPDEIAATAELKNDLANYIDQLKSSGVSVTTMDDMYAYLGLEDQEVQQKHEALISESLTAAKINIEDSYDLNPNPTPELVTEVTPSAAPAPSVDQNYAPNMGMTA